MAATLAPRSQPRRVDFFEERSDHECALFAAMGFSTAFITAKTRLSPSQISYRIRKAGLTKEHGTSRADFRNGTSPFAAQLLKAGRQIVDHDLVKFLHKHL